VTSASEQLCLACGLCCDGTLFDGVQLEKSDSAQRLQSLGLPVVVFRGKDPISRFSQPCAALCRDRKCQVYADRPKQCRIFECGVYKQAQAGTIDADTALRLVKKTRRLADRARRLLFQLGDTEVECSLGERFHRIQEHFEADPSDQAALALLADLSLVIHRLKLLAQEHFYTPPPGSGAGDVAAKNTKKAR